MITKEQLEQWCQAQGYTREDPRTYVKRSPVMAHRIRLSPQVFYRDVREVGKPWKERYRGRYELVAIHEDGTLSGIEYL